MPPSHLSQCDPTKILGCAMIAASLNLDINPNLGFASIVPYKKDGRQIPQFQMGWKGYVQLGQRTGQYKTMNVTEVYKDEFDSYDPFKGELVYHKVTGGDRDNDRSENVAGYVFYFELISGFSKMAYMSREKAEAHARRFSKAYQYDISKGAQSSTWSTMFDAMAMKTITKLTLSKWGVLSTQMLMANNADQSTSSLDDEGNVSGFEYVDNDNAEVIPGNEQETTPDRLEKKETEIKAELQEEPIKEEFVF
ncbi:MAG: recombinase RecT [Sphaerochaeta sp.]